MPLAVQTPQALPALPEVLMPMPMPVLALALVPLPVADRTTQTESPLPQGARASRNTGDAVETAKGSKLWHEYV